MLQNAQERHFAGGLFCDLPMGGVYLVRGENLALLGEVVRGRRWIYAPCLERGPFCCPFLKSASFPSIYPHTTPQDPARDASNPLLRRAAWEEVRAAEVAADEQRRAAAAAAAATAGQGSDGPKPHVPGKVSWTMGES